MPLPRIGVLDSRVPLASSEATQWFNTLEGSYDHVIYVADPELTEWSKKALRQADLVLCVGRKPRRASRVRPSLLEHFAEQMHGKGTLRLVLVQEGRRALRRHARAGSMRGPGSRCTIM